MKRTYKLFGSIFDNLNSISIFKINKPSLCIEYDEPECIFDFFDECHRVIYLSYIFSGNDFDFLEMIFEKKYKSLCLINDIDSSNKIVKEFLEHRSVQIASYISEKTNKIVYICNI